MIPFSVSLYKSMSMMKCYVHEFYTSHSFWILPVSISLSRGT
jgi:hypothetical protein